MLKALLKSKNWRWAALISLWAALAAFLYYFLPAALAIGYNYLWWTLWSSTVRVAAPGAVFANDTAPVVPKLLHQTWRNQDIPAAWQEAQASCRALHADYEYRLWTDEDARQLISTQFPWFLDTYDSYAFNIQRADVLRYFVLYQYGGIYLDMDVKCLKSLDYLRHYNFSAPKTYPIGVSNDVLLSQPRDAFALQLIMNLKPWNKWLFIRYVTVMFTTGPMYVTVQYTQFKQRAGFFTIPPEVYGKYKKTAAAYLKHLHGSSWHGKDAKFVFLLEHYGLQIAAMLVLVFVPLALIVGTYAKQWGIQLPVILQGGMSQRRPSSGNIPLALARERV